MNDFQDRVVLITGGGSGIGLALAQAFSQAGAHVVACGRDAGRLDDARSRCPGLETAVCDVTRTDAVAAMMADLQARRGRIDILVNNAGHLVERDFRAAPLDADSIASEVQVNLLAPLLVTNLALPLMPRRAGSAIVFVGSGYGWTPAARAPVYSAAKAGVRSFAAGLRLQLAGSGVAVMEVVPPVVDTPATADRTVRKISPQSVASATLAGLRRRRREVFIGDTVMLPWMLRMAPRLIERIVGGT